MKISKLLVFLGSGNRVCYVLRSIDKRIVFDQLFETEQIGDFFETDSHFYSRGNEFIIPIVLIHTLSQVE